MPTRPQALAALLEAILHEVGPVTLSKENAERVSSGASLQYTRHDDGRLTIGLASVEQQDAAASERQSHVSTSLPVERPVSVEQNEEEIAE